MAGESEDEVCHSFVSNGRRHVDCSGLGLAELPDGLDYQASLNILKYLLELGILFLKKATRCIKVFFFNEIKMVNFL